MGLWLARGRIAPAMLAFGLAIGLSAVPSLAHADEAPAVQRDAAVEERRADAAEKAERDAEKAERDAERAEEEAEREAERERRQEARDAFDAARRDLRRARDAVSAARGEVERARASGNAAEGQRRSAEDALAPTIVEHRRAIERRDDARRRVRVLRRDLVETEAELELARAQLDDRVVRAYKQGSVAAHMTLPLVLVQEAASPGELATAMKDLEAIAGFGALRVGELAEELVRMEAQLVGAVAEREDAELVVDETAGRIDDGEAAATEARAAAATVEAGLLSAIGRELELERAVPEAEEQVARARTRLDRVLAGDEDGARPSAADRDDADDADDPPTSGKAQRGGWLEGRQRALDRQQSLPADARRTADDWTCPVDGSRFVNDWGFPRSQERRHEGTDVFADEGTPIVATVDAEVTRIDRVDRFNGHRGFGGLTVTYEIDGARYYNAHLQRIAPDLEIGDEVEAGEVIGWVGRTGNARGTPPHLHLGVYVDDVAVNPYPSLAVACADDGRETGSDQDAERLAELDQRRAEQAQRDAEDAVDADDDSAGRSHADDDRSERRARREGDERTGRV